MAREFQSGPLMSPWERFRRKFLGWKPPAMLDSEGLPMPPTVGSVLICRRDEIPKFQRLVCDTCFHRWHAAEVVVGEVKAHRCLQVLNLFAEGVRDEPPAVPAGRDPLQLHRAAALSLDGANNDQQEHSCHPSHAAVDKCPRDVRSHHADPATSQSQPRGTRRREARTSEGPRISERIKALDVAVGTLPPQVSRLEATGNA